MIAAKTVSVLYSTAEGFFPVYSALGARLLWGNLYIAVRRIFVKDALNLVAPGSTYY